MHEAGNIGLEQRCSGRLRGPGADVTPLQVDINDLQGAQSTITSQLQSDPTHRRRPDAELRGRRRRGHRRRGRRLQARRSPPSTSTPTSSSGIQDGSIAFAVDQQQYEQGYLPIVMLQLYAKNLNTVGGGQPVLTGPGIVDADNVDEIADLASAGTR